METSVEQCPLCGTELSKIKFREIQSKLQEEEQRRSAEIAQADSAMRQRLEQQFKLDLEKQRLAAEKKAREEAGQEIKKVAAERDQAAKKLKEAQEREGEIRKLAEQEIARQKQAAEKKANEQAETRIKKVAAALQSTRPCPEYRSGSALIFHFAGVPREGRSNSSMSSLKAELTQFWRRSFRFT
jgi:hypothetical protein